MARIDRSLPLLLASASPRRRSMLARLGFEFQSVAPEVDEAFRPGETPEAYVLRVARDKATAGTTDNAVVVAADTTVVLGGEILGKPVDVRDAERMLRVLSGREHRVLTGLVVRPPRGAERTRVVESRVSFRPLADEEIRWYVATGEPLDKAGAYGIQEIGTFLVAEVHGSYTNVVGLPLAELLEDLRVLGVRLPWERP